MNWVSAAAAFSKSFWALSGFFSIHSVRAFSKDLAASLGAEVVVLLTTLPPEFSSRFRVMVPMSGLSWMLRSTMVTVVELKPGRAASTVQPMKAAASLGLASAAADGAAAMADFAGAITKLPLGSVAAV